MLTFREIRQSQAVLQNKGMRFDVLEGRKSNAKERRVWTITFIKMIKI